MGRPRCLGHLIAVALALVGATACATNPVTGRPEVVLISSAREQELSRQAAEQVAAEMGLVSDPELVGYVEQVGQRVAAHSPRQDVRYAFQVVDTPEPNAFALPGGQIYVSRGLLVLTNGEAELANVLGHEVAHVAARHAAQRQTRGVGVGLVLLPAAVAGAALGVAIGAPGDLLGAALNAPLRLAGGGFIAAYGRDQEREADRVGQALVAQAGSDPTALSRFMTTLLAYESLETGEPRRPGFLDTHPTTPERVRNTARRGEELQWSPAPGVAADRAEFLTRLAGIRVGANPAEGVFEGPRFLHPDLDLTLVFPEGWTLVNARAGVGAFAPDRDAQIVLEIDGEGSDPKAAAGRALESLGSASSVKLVRVEDDLAIGPHPAARVRLQASTGSGRVPLTMEVTWIAKEGLVYRLSAVAERGAFERHQAPLAAVAQSFRQLTPDERTGIRETRLRVIEARAGESLAGLGRRSGNVWSEAETAVANGLEVGAPLQAGQRLKVAVEQPYSPGTP